MRALIQRVKEAQVLVNGMIQGKVGRGMLIFLGVTHDDSAASALYLAQRCGNLRMFEDDDGKMDLSVKDVHGEALVVSQFTLYGDTRKGNRPSFIEAAAPDIAEEMYEEFVRSLRVEMGDQHVATGVFRAMMDVHLVNDGPVTLMIMSK